MSRSFSLGFLARVYSPTFSPQVYADTLALLAPAERLGLDSGWVAQHHFAKEQGRLPSPLLAAAITRTRRIQLGTGVSVLSQVLERLRLLAIEIALALGWRPIQRFPGSALRPNR